MDQKKLSPRTISANLLVYGTAHAVIDCVSAAVTFTLLKNQLVDLPDFISLVILYNVLAFGLQAIFGLIADHFKTPRAMALAGCVLTGISAITFTFSPVLAIIFAGIGNAAFHIGGGSISLNLTPGKAAAPGIYVAPGALGLMVGTLLGKNGQFFAWPFMILLAVLGILIFVVKKPKMNYQKENTGTTIKYFGIIALLVFMSIAIRSLVGFVITFPWKSDINLLIILTVGVVLGKGLGGILADKFGWIKIAVGALVLSIPLLLFGTNIPFLGITGMFLFNITMPITLVALSNLLPGRPGFAFGLTCLALILGALPVLLGFKSIFIDSVTIFAIISISAIALYIGLQLLLKKKLTFKLNK